ncbi:ASCH domain-containing protein [Mucisphaera calidilacus]|uniref:ASCH domain-containing protein n=1 Tax=Mucisphaera calidilacus TaxID=2527982 RepID=A0A518BWF3_9BACT|nr:ASCH domain-containing protein [Mucisphaera calidilacus]QDU71298.1 hypothetical protein Pan265_11470 [Mucisphaera calidilacus]
MPAHLAIIRKPYLELILEGRKRVECRLTRHRIPPWQAIEPGDAVLLKQSSGPIRGIAMTREVFARELGPGDLAAIRRRFNHAIHAGPDFWAQRAEHRYLTLVTLCDVAPLAYPDSPARSSGRAWITLSEEQLLAKRITVTAGAIRNSYLRVPASCQHLMLKEFTLTRPGTPDVRTSLRTGIFRERDWRGFYTRHNIVAGDNLWLVRAAPDHFLIAIPRRETS